MAAILKSGPRAWMLTRDEEGHREYKVVHLVKTTDLADGPAVVLSCTGLPQVGDVWQFGNDLDVWAWCWPDATAKPHEEKEGERGYWWRVEQKFSTKPLKKCKEQKFEDPLLEPFKVTGSTIKASEEATKDRYGKALLNSAHEVLRGAAVEFDKSRPQVRIEMNVATFNQIALAKAMQDRLNNAPLWGFPQRCIKLSDVTWSKEYYGRCYSYYKLALTFDIRNDTFDRDVLDEGTKALRGRFINSTGVYVIDDIGGSPADPRNPQHFAQFKDPDGENIRVVLNGRGLPAGVGVVSGTVTVCAEENSNPAYRDWELTISGIDNPEGMNVLNCPVINGVWKLTNQGGCTWQSPVISGGGLINGIANSVMWKLTIADGLVTLRLQNADGNIGANDIYYDLTTIEFNGVSSNTIASVVLPTLGPCDRIPYEVVIRPWVERTDIGSIHIEHYQEANFLLLGIPISL